MRLPKLLETRKVPEAVLRGARKEGREFERIATVKIPGNPTNSFGFMFRNTLPTCLARAPSVVRDGLGGGSL